ncbi:hypothetical protein ACNQFZ_01495 [Schinkia sp. CFF1]
MSLFVKHEVKENGGRFEAILFLNKKKADHLLDDDYNRTIKKEALTYIKSKFPNIPIKVVRIMVGSFLYFSFSTNSRLDF